MPCVGGVHELTHVLVVHALKDGRLTPGDEKRAVTIGTSVQACTVLVRHDDGCKKKARMAMIVTTMVDKGLDEDRAEFKVCARPFELS